MSEKPDRNRILLILDVDETLIYASEDAVGRKPDFVAYQYNIYRRPHLDHFLEVCSDHFDLAVWSSASDQYVEEVVRQIFPDPSMLHFVWGRSRATLRRVITDDGYFSDPWNHLHYRKPLAKVKKLGWSLERILIVDDTPQKAAHNYGNAIYPKPYTGEQDDDELLLLSDYLVTLKDVPNVRTLEKRHWKSGLRGKLLS